MGDDPKNRIQICPSASSALSVVNGLGGAVDSNEKYNVQWEALARDPRGFEVFQEPVHEPGPHPENFIDHECAFAARHIYRTNPKKILDIGSYRHFILGLLAHYPVTTIDVRPRKTAGENESLATCDAKKLDLPDGSFDLVLSLCTLEHFGLGRYGDEFDLEADLKAFAEMIRVLKTGGILVFTTTITRAAPSVAFNAHRIYDHPLLRALCAGLACEEERYYSHEKGEFCALQEVTDKPKWWDVYCGCWKK
jgi:SAM-dependent methyltransferase